MDGSSHTRRRPARSEDGDDNLLLHQAPAPATPVGLMTVGAADHPAEHAADAAADRALSVLDRLRPAAAAPAGHAGHDHSGHDHVRRLATPGMGGAEVGRDGGAVAADTDSRVRSLQGRGRPLPDQLRRQMEQAFDSPLDRVRVHTGAESADLNQRMSAKAFTVGQDIFLGGDQLTSDRAGDRHTLAHEIAHTVQDQSGIHRQWKDAGSLSSHWTKHGTEFPTLSTEADYETEADSLFANKDSLQKKTAGNGTIRVYDSATNTFGSFQADGKAITLFKPTRAQAYFDDQPGA